MSRSHRKPYLTDNYGHPCKQWYKRHHNHKLRRKLNDIDYEISNGCAHKNCSGVDRWDIMDFSVYLIKPIEDDYLDEIEIYRKLERK